MTTGRDASTDPAAPQPGLLNATRPMKRSFAIRGHKTSISLEAAFWSALQEIAAEQRLAMAALVAAIDQGRGEAGLSGAVRIFILDHYRSKASRAPVQRAEGP